MKSAAKSQKVWDVFDRKLAASRTMAMRIQARACLVLLTVCIGGREARGAPPRPATPDRRSAAAAAPAHATCTARVKALRLLLARLELQSIPERPLDAGPPHSRRGRPAREAGQLLVVDAGGAAQVGHRDLGLDRAALAAALVATFAFEREVRPGLAPRVYLWVDPRLPITTLGEVIDIASRSAEVRILVQPQAPSSTPPARLLAASGVKQLLARLTTEHPAQRLAVLAEVIGEVAEPCAPLVAVLRATAREYSEDKQGYLASRAPSALEACGCAVTDLDVLEYALLAGLGAYVPPLRWLPPPTAALLGAVPGTVGEALETTGR